jgi:hypothetical protein
MPVPEVVDYCAIEHGGGFAEGMTELLTTIDPNSPPRYRFTASYLDILVATSFRSPHKLLNRYVQHFTSHEPSDTPDFINEEDVSLDILAYLRATPFPGLDKITKSAVISLLFSTLSDACFWLCRSGYRSSIWSNHCQIYASWKTCSSGTERKGMG